MEKPRIRPVPLKDRCVAVSLVFGAYGPTRWECCGRGVEGYGIDPESAYRHWRRRLAEKKRQGISDVRVRKSQEDMIKRGFAYRKPDGTMKYRMGNLPVKKATPARKPSAWGKVFGK